MKSQKNTFNDEVKELEYNNIKHIIKTGKLEDLKSIEKEYADNIKVQSALIKRYIQEKQYKSAMFICKKYEYYEVIQSQLVTIYMAERRYEKAIQICKRFPDYKEIQCQLVTIYTKQRRYDEAIEICKRFYEHDVFKSQLVKIYFYQNEFNKALKICNDIPYDASIQNQLMTLYIKQGNFEEAISLAKKFPNNEIIQYKLLTIYLRFNELDKVINICKRFPKNKVIQEKVKGIMVLTDTRDDDVLQQQLDNLICQNKEFYKNDIALRKMLIGSEIEETELSKIRTKLANNTITLSDFENLNNMQSQLDINSYKFLQVAIYHRLGLLKSALQVLKTIDSKYNQNKVAIFNALNSKKTTFYNLGLYDQVIDWCNISSNINSKQIVKVKSL